MSESVLTHKCPNCDGPLLFDPLTQQFECEYCHSKFTEAEVLAFETAQGESSVQVETPTAPPDAEKETAATESDTTADEMSLFLCPSCGAEIVTDATTAATYCYFCHNPVVLSGRLSGQFLPNTVVPFAIDKKAATAAFLSWTKKKKFIPKNFFTKNQIEKLTGVYFPYWQVDAELDGELNAQANSISVWRAGDIEYTQTKKYSIFRKGSMHFRDLIKNALSKNISQKMVESVQPFLMEKAVPFQTQYLSGFQAEKRDIEYQDLADLVQKELQNYAGELLTDTVSGYTTVYNKQTKIQLKEQQQRYTLLPVWLLTYKSTGNDQKIYYYAMNGQTGKVSGVLPINKGKLLFYASISFLLCFLIFLIGGYLL